ncbi:hypothetical protein [Streptomyces sp. 7N604]|uniref:hypothetical protein n=1 Tax=Streptomyces sp. 7N604 TaxID=3457415 RepID=UPI003FD48DC7
MTVSIPSSERGHRAAVAFDCPTGDLAAGLLRFTGLPALNGASAHAALSVALDLVSEEPQLPEWCELARIPMWHGRLNPLSDVELLAPPARSVLRQMCRYADAMDEEALRSAALAMVPRVWLLEALADAVEAQGAERDTAAPAGRAADRAFLRSAAELELMVLTDESPGAWGTVAGTALRAALVGRLAFLSSVFAEVAGLPQAPSLAWQEVGPGRWRAVECLPGATAPLVITAKLDPSRARESVPNLSVAGAARWCVSWDVPGAGSCTYEAGNAGGLGFAQWHAHQAVQRLRCTPGGARHGGRLLIPVDPSAPASVAPPVRHLGLGAVLSAVIARWEDALIAGGPAGGLWVSLPHMSPGGEAASAAAALLHDLEAPCPTAAEPVNHAAVDAPGFAAFLASHALALTPAARAYLAGLADSGPGPDTIAHRHAAAMRAVLALLLTPSQASAVAAEIGPPPADGGYRALLDPTQLADHVRLHTRDEAPPDGLDPAQLGAVRQEICDGLAAVARLYMRRELQREHLAFDDLKKAVADFVAERNSFPDPYTSQAEPGPAHPLLPDPPLRFTVSFRTVEELCTTSFSHTTDVPGPAPLQLLLPADWGKDVAAAGFAVLAGRPVIEVLRADDRGRPDVVRILELDVNRRCDGGTAAVWQLDADCPLVNVDWTSGSPRLYMPLAADEGR